MTTTVERAAVCERLAHLHLPTGVLSPRHMARLTSALAADAEIWRPLVRHDTGQRWYTRLWSTSQFEVWLIGWDAGQDTTIHDHGGSSGSFAVCEGILVEDHTQRAGSGRLRRDARPAGSVRSFGPTYVHNIVDNGPGPATSIHAYSPPLSIMNFYDVLDGRLRRVSTVPVAGPEPDMDAAAIVDLAGGEVA